MKKKIYYLSVILWLLAFSITKVAAQGELTLTYFNPDTNQFGITNTGDSALDVSEYRVCLGPGQYDDIIDTTIINGDLMLSANETVVLEWDTIGVENADGAGGLGLFAPTGPFGSTNPAIYLDYVQWGGASQDRSQQAVNTGLWDSASNFVAGLPPFTTIAGGSAAAWETSVGNPDATLTMVDTDTNAVTITNLSTEDGDISSYWVCLGPGQYGQLSSLSIVSGDYVLAPEESVTFTFPLIAAENEDGAGGLGLFSTNSFASTNPDIYVDFMQWGDANQDRSAQAVTTGIWDSATNFVEGLSPYTTTTGGSAAAWMGAGAPVEFTAILSGVQENPAAFTPATGIVNAILTGNELVVSGSFEGLRGELYTPAAGGDHIHRALAGRNGGIELQLTAVLSDGNTAGVYNAEDNTFVLTDDQVAALNAREFYVNIHSSVFTGGELRGQILPSSDDFYQATLLGSNEVPSINTTAGGNLLFELEGDQLAVSGSFDELSSEIRIDLANGAHIHLSLIHI